MTSNAYLRFCLAQKPSLIAMGGSALSAFLPVSDEHVACEETSWVKMLQLKKLRLRAAAREPPSPKGYASEPTLSCRKLPVSSSC